MVGLLSKYIHTWKRLKILEIDFEADSPHWVREMHEISTELWIGLLKCNCSLEHLKVPNASIGLPVFTQVLKKFKTSLRAFQVQLINCDFVYRGMVFKACGKDISDALESVALFCGTLKRVCLRMSSRLGGIEGERLRDEDEQEPDDEMCRFADAINGVLQTYGLDKETFYHGLEDWTPTTA
ncbi:hypothetical protein FGB62_203g034 [Gracilaria domingensis]|nr:hypothetical protein FGB62_203g034 [Gracilaria domingensis]